MKKIFLVAMVAMLFAACESNSPKRYTQASAEIDEIKALINDYETQNWDGWKSHYADTAKSFYNTKGPGVATNKAVEMLKEGVSGLSSYGFEKDDGDMEMVIDDKGRTWVNFWGTWKGTLSANNQELIVPVHLTFQMIDKKIVREYGYWDNAPRMKAEMEIASPAEVKSAVMTKDGTTKTDAVMKKTEPEKKKVAKNKDATMKKN